MAHLQSVALVVRDYDEAIRFFVDILQFELLEDSPSVTNDGRPKRWVVVRPVGGQTGLLLARADGEHQAAVVGEQFAGRVGLFLRVDDFEATYERMIAAGVRFVSAPREEGYGRVAVFLDLEGNRWDLLGPPGRTAVLTLPHRGQHAPQALRTQARNSQVIVHKRLRGGPTAAGHWARRTRCTRCQRRVASPNRLKRYALNPASNSSGVRLNAP